MGKTFKRNVVGIVDVTYQKNCLLVQQEISELWNNDIEN
jgi:hypothetical protein